MKETINKMYWTLRMSVQEIATALDVDIQTVVDAIEQQKWTL